MPSGASQPFEMVCSENNYRNYLAQTQPPCMYFVKPSASIYHRLLKLAHTIADLAGCEAIQLTPRASHLVLPEGDNRLMASQSIDPKRAV